MNFCRVTLFSLWLSGLNVFAQQPFPYIIDKVISENKITDLNTQKILIIDFWATWCVPCVAATEQLEIIQRAVPDKVFIVSVSDESEKTISDYLLRTPIALTVIKDLSENGLISRFKVKQRPYAVMLNMNGDILFKGHPSEITIEKIKKLAASSQVMNCDFPNSLFTLNQSTYAVPKPSKDQFHLTKNSAAREEYMYSEDGVFHYSGPLSGLMKYLFEVSKFQIVLEGKGDFGIDFACSQEDIAKAKKNPSSFVENRLFMKVLVNRINTEYISLDVENPEKLWDSSQIDWGSDPGSRFIIGEDRIEADNLTIHEIANLLSDVKKKFFYYKGNDNKVYDWNFQYLYDDLLSEDLKYSYGISLKQEKGTVPVYVINSM